MGRRNGVNLQLVTGAVLLLALAAVCYARFTAETETAHGAVGAMAESSAAVSSFVPEATPTIDTEPPPAASVEPRTFTIAMMGDCALGSEHNLRGTSGSYERVVNGDWSYPFSGVRELYADADFVIANLECALTEYNVPEPKEYRFRGVPESARILTEGGIDFVTLGNNHSRDYGETGYADTQTVLDEYGIGYAPDGESRLYETDTGLIIGVYSSNLPKLSKLKEAVAALRESGAELVIAAFHFGVEGSYTPSQFQVNASRAAVESGAHIVMGTHPHVLQPVELYGGAVICYSLGNWTFGGNTNPRDKDSAIVFVTVERGADGAIGIGGYEAVPCSISGETGRNDYRPVPYEPDSEGYERVMSKLSGTYEGKNLYVSYG